MRKRRRLRKSTFSKTARCLLVRSETIAPPYSPQWLKTRFTLRPLPGRWLVGRAVRPLMFCCFAAAPPPLAGEADCCLATAARPSPKSHTRTPQVLRCTWEFVNYRTRAQLEPSAHK